MLAKILTLVNFRLKCLKILLIKNQHQNIWTACVHFQQIVRQVNVKGNASLQCSLLRTVKPPVTYTNHGFEQATENINI